MFSACRPSGTTIPLQTPKTPNPPPKKIKAPASCLFTPSPPFPPNPPHHTFIIFFMLYASAMVTASGRPSGTATTTMVTAYRKNSTTPPWFRWFLRALQPSGDLKGVWGGGWGWEGRVKGQEGGGLGHASGPLVQVVLEGAAALRGPLGGGGGWGWGRGKEGRVRGQGEGTRREGEGPATLAIKCLSMAARDLRVA